MAKKDAETKEVATTERSRLPAEIKEGDYALFHVAPERVKSLVKYNVGNKGINQFNLTRVNVPGTGVTTWSIETLRGEEETKELRGIIVAYREPRARWKDSYESSGGGTPPDCSSEDGLMGIGDPGGACTGCQFAEFGSEVKADGSPGRGQACKQMRTLFMLRGRSLLPMVITVPPTSLGAVETYFLNLLSEAYEFFAVETIIQLEKDKNKDGQVFAKMVFRIGRDLSDEEIQKVEAYAESLKATFDAHKVFDRGEKQEATS